MNNELTIEKIRNMLLAHNDGVYLLQSRDDPAEVIEYLLTKIDRIAYCATTIREAARREMDMGCNHAGGTGRTGMLSHSIHGGAHKPTKLKTALNTKINQPRNQRP